MQLPNRVRRLLRLLLRAGRLCRLAARLYGLAARQRRRRCAGRGLRRIGRARRRFGGGRRILAGRALVGSDPDHRDDVRLRDHVVARAVDPDDDHDVRLLRLHRCSGGIRGLVGRGLLPFGGRLVSRGLARTRRLTCLRSAPNGDVILLRDALSARAVRTGRPDPVRLLGLSDCSVRRGCLCSRGVLGYWLRRVYGRLGHAVRVRRRGNHCGARRDLGCEAGHRFRGARSWNSGVGASSLRRCEKACKNDEKHECPRGESPRPKAAIGARNR